MSRQFFGIEKGLDIYAENGGLQVRLLSGTAAPTGTGDQSDAPIGSLYIRSGTGELYQKILNNGNSGDWELNGASQAAVGNWRGESLLLVTDEVQGAGTRDVVASPFVDDDGAAVPLGDYQVGGHIISDADGTPALLEITNVSGNNVTFAVASPALAQSDTFVTEYYLPDSPDAQEGYAVVVYNGSVMVKIADINWNLADGINMAAGYAAQNGSITSADTVNSAIEKLDGNQQDLTSAVGVAQGDTDIGTFTGDIISDNTTVVGALQELETELVDTRDNVDDLITLSGVAENSTDLGTFSGDIITDNTTIAGALQDLETELVDTRDNTDDLITLSGVAENDTDLGTFTGGLIPDGQTVKQALQVLETQAEDSISDIQDIRSAIGIGDNETDLGLLTSTVLADNQTAKQLFQRISDLLEQMRGVEVTGITTITTVDEVPHATVSAVKWLVEAFEEATPANRKSMEVYALTNGTAVDDTQYAKLDVGANFNLSVSVEIIGADMSLRVASTTAGVTVRAKKIEVVKSTI